MTALFEEHQALTSLFGSLSASPDYDITEDERHVLRGCEQEAQFRGVFGAGVACIAAQLTFSRRPLGPASIVATVAGAAIGGYVAGVSSVRPCLTNLVALEHSLLALEAQRILRVQAPTRCGRGCI